MILLSSAQADSNGFIAFKHDPANSVIERASARIQVDKLLDGTTYVKHHAISAGDRVIEIMSKRPYSREVTENINRLYRLNNRFLLSVLGEFFVGIISFLDTDKGFITFKFIPESKLR